MTHQRNVIGRSVTGIVGLAAGVVLASCGSGATISTSTAGATVAPSSASPVVVPATASPTVPPVEGAGAADPVAAVKAVTGSGPGCQGASFEVASCPITVRLAQRIDSAPFSGPGGGASPLCRCQNMGTPTFTLSSVQAGTALVSEDIGFGPPLLRWTVIQVSRAWYVDDQDQGCAQTSIYSSAYDHTGASSSPAPAAPQC